MLVDPITVAADAPTPALNFAVVSYNGEGSVRKDVTNGYTLNFSHSQNKNTGERHYMQIQQSVTAVDPITGGNAYQTASVSISSSFPTFGWTQAQKDALVKALLDTLQDSDVTITKFNSFQS
jgi:lysozyme family protein